MFCCVLHALTRSSSPPPSTPFRTPCFVAKKIELVLLLIKKPTGRSYFAPLMHTANHPLYVHDEAVLAAARFTDVLCQAAVVGRHSSSHVTGQEKQAHRAGQHERSKATTVANCGTAVELDAVESPKPEPELSVEATEEFSADDAAAIEAGSVCSSEPSEHESNID